MAVYLLTMPPILSWAHYGADGGDLVTAIVRGSLPHPPGFPMYLLLGKSFTLLPWGDPAWRLNLLSAVMAAGATLCTALSLRHLLHPLRNTQDAIRPTQPATRNLQSTICNSQSAILPGLTLGLAPLFWSQALIAEVYASAAFFAALVMLWALIGGPAWALGLAWGMGLGVHPTLLFLAPLVGWALWSPRAGRIRRLLQAGLAAVGTWAVLYGPILWLWGRAPSPWADLSQPAGWWAYVSGRLYHHYVFALPAAFWPQRFLAWLGIMAQQFTPLGALLTGWGWGHLWREQRSLAISTALAFGGFSLYALGYNTADSLVYLVPALPIAALWLGLGLRQVADRLRAHRAAAVHLLWLLPLLQLVLFWRAMDIHDDRSALRWAQEKLEAAPPRAVLLTAQDAHTFTLWYAQDVLNMRPDVVVVDRDLWGHPPYRRMLTASLGEAVLNPALSPDEAARDADRPIVEVTDDP